MAQSTLPYPLETQQPLVYELETPLETSLDSSSAEGQPTHRPLRNRVDDLEEQISELENQQVSPVIRMLREVIFGISDVTGQDVDEATSFQNSVDLTRATVNLGLKNLTFNLKRYVFWETLAAQELTTPVAD